MPESFSKFMSTHVFSQLGLITALCVVNVGITVPSLLYSKKASDNTKQLKSVPVVNSTVDTNEADTEE